MGYPNPGFAKILEVRRELRDLSIGQWLNEDIHRWTWWLSLALSILPWIVWWKIADRKRVFEILAYGLLVGMLSAFLDVLGVGLVLWGYPNKLLPTIPPLFPIDFTVLPVLNMLIYQYCSEFKKFLAANFLMAAGFAFVVESLLEGLNLYTLINWKHIYSFPIYIAVALVSRWLVKTIGIKSGSP